jgi:nicotinamide mononucleotide (NMN) deamidase PncC
MSEQTDGAMPPDVSAAVRLIHASSTRAVLHVTGGASYALPWLLATPGASSTVLDAAVPYSRRALLRLLNNSANGELKPSSFASAPVAERLGAAAYRRAVTLSRGESIPLVGVAASCALGSSAPKRGDHRAHVAVVSDEATIEYELVLAKGGRDRAAEDRITSRLVVAALLDACVALPSAEPTNMSLVRSMLIDGDILRAPRIVERRDTIGAVVDEQDERAVFAQMDSSGRWRQPGAVSVDALLPGSFNPVHAGHRQLVAAAQAALGPDAIVGYELAVTNPDKPPLDASTVRRRAAQFVELDSAVSHPLVLTREPMFVGKASALPNTVFVVGYDTASRIVDARYYNDGDERAMLDALMSIARNGCSFLVAGRRAAPTSGEFLTLSNVPVPPGFGSLFAEIPEDAFRSDISSTQIRQQRQAQDQKLQQ